MEMFANKLRLKNYTISYSTLDDELENTWADSLTRKIIIDNAVRSLWAENKAIPVLTGILPTAAAIAGIRRGVNTAGRRLAGGGDLKRVAQLETQLAEAAKRPPAKGIEGDKMKKINVDKLSADLQEKQDQISIETFKDALKYGAGYTTAAALTGQALESIRRDMGRED